MLELLREMESNDDDFVDEDPTSMRNDMLNIPKHIVSHARLYLISTVFTVIAFHQLAADFFVFSLYYRGLQFQSINPWGL